MELARLGRSHFGFVLLAAILVSVAFLLGLPAQLLLLAILSLLTPMLVVARDRPIDLLEPVWLFSIVYTVGYGFKGALLAADPVQYSTFPQYIPESPHYLVVGVLLSIGGLLAFLSGYFSHLPRLVAGLIPNLGQKVIRPRRLWFASAIGFCAGVASLALLTRLASVQLTPSALFDREVRAAILNQLQGRGAISIFIFLMPLFSLALVYYYLTYRPGRARVRIFGIIAVTFWIFGLLGGRVYLLGYVAGLAILFHYCVHRVRLLGQTGFLAVLAVAAFALGVLLYRGSGYGWSSVFVLIRALPGTFDSLDHLAIALSREVAPFWGLSVFEDVFVTFIPRALFEAKPLIYGAVRLQEVLVPGITAGADVQATFPPSILAEGYLNFGLAGMLALPFATGVILRTLYDKAMSEGGVSIVVLAVLSGQMINALRGFGSFTQAFVLVVGTALLFFRMRLPSPRQTQGQALPATE